MLLGRDREQALLEAVLESARRGTSRALVVRGEPGIGKTALLDLAEERVAGMGVLRARGLEAEAAIPFAALTELLRPVLGHLPAIPPPQAAALAGALALGPSVPGDPFTTSAATLSLLAAAAEDEPLLVLVDDAHWLDPSSATALLFAARRGRAEGIAFVFAAREREPSHFASEGIEELHLGPIDLDSSRALLALAAGTELEPAVAGRLLELAGGNPLALLEAPAALAPAQLAGAEPLPGPVPIGRRLEETYLERVRRLPASTQTALLVAAASSGRMGEIAAALRALAVPPAAFEAAEAAALVSIAGGSVAFRHPLLVSAVYHGGSPGDRRAAHRALGQTTEGEPRAWHLAAAATGPDEEAAAALEQAAETARLRGAHAAAAAAYERAAVLSSNGDRQLRRLVEAARALQVAGRLERSTAILHEALARADNGSIAAEMHHLRARAEMLGGEPMKAYELLLAEATRITPTDPEKAVFMLAEASGCASFAGHATHALHAAERAQSLAGRTTGAAQLSAAVFLAWTVLLAAGDGPRAREILVRCAPAVEGLDPVAAAPLVQYAAATRIALGDVDVGRRLVDRLLAAARAAGAPGAVAFPLVLRADIDFRVGRWDSSYARASEALTLARETGQANIAIWALARVAAVEAGRGRDPECRAHMVEALRLGRSQGSDAVQVYADAFLGLLALGAGDPDDAIAHLEDLTRFEKERGVSADLIYPYGADLVDAYRRVGRREDAERALAEFTARARRADNPIALAGAARSRGMLAEDDGFEQDFADAHVYLSAVDAPFERARTLLAYGERLRRVGRRRDARDRLRHALTVFEDLGAEAWAARARAELQATGETIRRREASEEELTPQELQVALAIAGGATNREAAAALFLSPKTIEYHLTHVYAKLGLRSRSELARRFAREVESREPEPRTAGREPAGVRSG